jgi:hypothetical protein
MTAKDFENAAQNISDIMITIASAVKIAWNGGTLIFSDGSSWTIGTGIGKMCDSDEFKKIIESFSEIGDLIGNISEGVQKYANLMIPTFGADGKIVGARQMTSSDMSTAGANIVTVLMTLLTGGSTEITNKNNITSGLIGAYNLLTRYDIEDDFGEIVEMFGKTGELISNIATGIQAYADLKIATSWDAEGKPRSFRKLSENDFKNASNNIMTVLGTVLFGADSVSDSGITVKGGIVGFYDKLCSFGIEEDIKDIIESFVPAGELISSMAESIGSFSKMQFATAWNNEGKPISFTKVTSNDVIEASKNIMQVLGITLFGANAIDENGGIKNKTQINGGIVGFYNQLVRSGLDGEIKEILESLLPAGELISSMAESIATYSKMQYATDWNDEGKPKAFRQITGQEMISASINIMNILGTMLFGANAIGANGTITVTGGIVGFYNKLSSQNIELEIKEIIESMLPVGKLLESMATGISAFAQMMIPTKWNAEGKPIEYKQLTKNDFDNVNKNIETLMTTLSNAVRNAYSTAIKPVLNDGGDFKEAVESIALIGNAVKSIADGVQAYAEMRIPTGWDGEGKPTGYKKMPDNYISKAKDNIKNIIITLAEAISETWKGSGEKAGINKILPSNIIQKMTEKIQEINNVIVSVGTLVSGISEMKIATAWDAEGKPTNFISITTDDKNLFTRIRTNINSLLTEIPLGIHTAYSANKELFDVSDSKSYTKKIINTLPDLNSVLLQMKIVLDTFGTGDWMKNVYAYKKRTTRKIDGLNLSIGMFVDTYVITDEISTLITKLATIPAVDNQLDTIDKSFSVLSARIYELSAAINCYYENKAFEENINRVSRFVSETVNTLDVEKIDHLIALIESMNRLSDKTTTLDSLTNAIANNLSVVLKQLGDKMTEAKTTIEITEKIQEKRHKLINESIAKVKDIMANEIVVSVNTSNNSSSTSTGSTSSGGSTSTGSTSSSGGSGVGMQSNIGDGTGANAAVSTSGNTLGGGSPQSTQQGQGNNKQNGNTNSTGNTHSSTINDMAEKINRIYNIIQERF